MMILIQPEKLVKFLLFSLYCGLLASNGEQSGASGDVPEDAGSDAVAATSSMDHQAKPEPDDEDDSEDFVSQLTHVEPPVKQKLVKGETEVR